VFIPSKIPKIIFTGFPLLPKKIAKLKPFIHKKKPIENNNRLTHTPTQQGHDEHTKNQIRKKEETLDTVNQLIKKSNRRIMSISSFSLLPGFFQNTIEVEESRIIFIFKQPFTFQSHSVDIADVSNVFIESAFFFAKMQVVSRTFIQNDITIGNLSKTEANKIRRIIEGLRTFARAKIDTSVYEVDELIQKLEELHQTRE